MNKNRVLFILVISFITMFGFKLDVYAKNATELTCLYEKNSSKYKAVLVQDKTGKLSAFYHTEDVDFNSSSKWEIANEYGTRGVGFVEKSNVCSNVVKDSNGYLTECPKYSKQAKTLWATNLYFCNDDSYPNKLVKKANDSAVLNTDSENITTHSGSSEVTTGVDSTGKTCKEMGEIGSAWLTDSTATLRCLYCKKIDEGTHLVEIDISKTAIDYDIGFVSNYADLRKIDRSKVTYTYHDKFEGSINDIASLFNGSCPLYIGVRTNSKVNMVSISNKFNSGTGFEKYTAMNQKGHNLVSGEKIDFEDMKEMVKIEPVEVPITSCSQLIDGTLSSILKNAIIIIKILVPIILLVLGSLDFVKAIFAQDEAGIKKAQAAFIKRLIISVVIFLIPTLLHAILLIANSAWSWIDPTLCGLI